MTAPHRHNRRLSDFRRRNRRGRRFGDRDLRDLDPGEFSERVDVVCADPASGIDHDVSAGHRIGRGVVVRKVSETRLGCDERKAVGLELVDPSRHLQTAGVAIRRVLVAGRLACALDDRHIEAGVVRHEDVAPDEGREVAELGAPAQGADDVFFTDAVDARVQLEEPIVPSGRLDEPSGLVDDLAVPHTHEAYSTRGRIAGVRRFEVDCGEVQGHHPSVTQSCAPAREARRRGVVCRSRP